MRILVIDDTVAHQDAAREQLRGHELTVVGTYDDGERLLQEESFDVVLTDLLMPASERTQGPDGRKFVGQEMPVGIFLALLAATRGARYVGLLTATNHHAHPASACLDAFQGRGANGQVMPGKFSIGSATVSLANSGFGPYSDGKTDAKRWGAFLAYLTE